MGIPVSQTAAANRVLPVFVSSLTAITFVDKLYGEVQKLQYYSKEKHKATITTVQPNIPPAESHTPMPTLQTSVSTQTPNC